MWAGFGFFAVGWRLDQVKALQFYDDVPRYALTKAIGNLRVSAFWGNLSCVRYVDVPEPEFPTPEWVRVHTRYGGICGSDIGLIRLHSSTSSAPFTSFPFTIGHENVGRIAELGSAVTGFSVGQRVVVDPLLHCRVRGFRDLCPACARGDQNLCHRFREGTLAPGMLTGFCHDTGGSWSHSFIAHQAQLVPVPDSVSDENAVLAEPFAVALHATLRNRPKDTDTVLILGAGIVGLCTLAALRAIGSKARVIVTARHNFQQEAARRLGADIVLRGGGGLALYRDIVDQTGGEVLKPIIGKHVVRGGADIVYECVGSSQTIDDGLRLTAAGGTMVLVGLAAAPRGIDWSPIWMNEVEVRGTFCYATEEFEGKQSTTMELAVRLLAEAKADLSSLLTHQFALDDFRQALETVTTKGRNDVIKAVFAFPQE